MQQLKEKETRIELPLSRYTPLLSSFSSIDPTRFEKRTPHIIFPRQKTAYREIFILVENSHSKNLIGARFYDPVLGVWLTPDPAGEFHDSYSYVGGDPVNFIDPLGLYSWNRLWQDTKGVGATVGINLVGIPLYLVTGGQSGGVGYVWFDDDGNVSHSDGWGFGEVHPGPNENDDPLLEDYRSYDDGLEHSSFEFSWSYHANDNMDWLKINGKSRKKTKGFEFSIGATLNIGDYPGSSLQESLKPKEENIMLAQQLHSDWPSRQPNVGEELA